VFVSRLLSDGRFGIRQLRKNPTFALTTILTLALGIGATTAIFSLVYAVMLKPLPFPESERLVWLSQEDHSTGAVIPESLSYPDYFDWRAQNRTLTGIASFTNANATLTGMGEAQHLNSVTVSSNFFQVLGAAPMLGRDFLWEEEKPGHRGVMLSYSLWQSRFGASRQVVGQPVTLNSLQYTIVGVMPKGFNFPIQLREPAVDLWTSLAATASGPSPMTAQRGMNTLEVIGRMKPAVTLQQAKAELNVIARNLAKQYPDSNKWYTTALVKPEFEHLVGDTRPGLQVLFGAVVLVLLIACVNVAGLLLTRSAQRRAEVALRGVLGASRMQIVRQMLVESLMLSLLGGAAGIALAMAILQGAIRFLPQTLPRLNEVSLNGTVLAFAVGLSVLTGLLFGVLPAVRISRLDPALALREGTRTVTGGRVQQRLQMWMVVGETALGLVLLVGAGLLIRSFVGMLRVDPGFDPHGVFTARLSLPDNEYPHDQKIQFIDRLLPQLASLPGVKSASAGWPMPMSGSSASISFTVEGHPMAKADHPNEALGLALPGYFETMRIPLIAGRTFAAQDGTKAPPVAIVNQAFAKKYFAGVNPVGKHMTADLGDDAVNRPVREIVGVVGDIKEQGITAESDPEFYLPWTQAVVTTPYLCLRTAGKPEDLQRAVSAVIAQMDPSVPVYQVHDLDFYIARSVAQPRFQTLLVASFAAMALLLAAVGLYGVLSYIVQQRSMEIALRVAVGAQRGEVLGLVLKRGMALAAIGVAVGLGISACLARFMATLLYGVRPIDPLTFVGVSILLLLVALAASLAPAYRAAQADPMITLRNQ
jgi:putative ABC transport system permease protein